MKYIIYGLLLLSFQMVIAQKYDNHWIFGYAVSAGGGWQGTDINFTNDTLQIDSIYFDINFDNTNASISDKNGNLLFYTNGFAIENAQNDTLCSGLNPEGLSSQWQFYGNRAMQGALFLPKPDDSTQYYLFHCAIAKNSNTGNYYSPNIRTTLLEITPAYPLGHVVTKNQVILSGDFETGCITATKHANGRDWWILIKERGTTKYHRFMLTPSGIKNLDVQDIGQGITNPLTGWQSCFSPDGSKYAKYECEKIHLYDFDRCTGELSNYDSVLHTCEGGAAGIGFSPNSRFLYISTGTKLYQYDTDAINLGNSQILIDTFDGFTSPPPFMGLPTSFFLLQLAPDGKIYISTTNGTPYLHVIDYPDSLGTACSFRQHAVLLRGYNAAGIPNFPNYRLGALAGSPCDTLTSKEEGIRKEVSLYPNPTRDKIHIELENVREPLTFVLLNVLGQEEGSYFIENEQGNSEISLAHLPKGIYFYLLKSEKGILAQGKVVKE